MSRVSELRPWRRESIAEAPAGAQFLERREVLAADEEDRLALKERIAKLESTVAQLQKEVASLEADNRSLEEREERSDQEAIRVRRKLEMAQGLAVKALGDGFVKHALREVRP